MFSLSACADLSSKTLNKYSRYRKLMDGQLLLEFLVDYTKHKLCVYQDNYIWFFKMATRLFQYKLDTGPNSSNSKTGYDCSGNVISNTSIFF